VVGAANLADGGVHDRLPCRWRLALRLRGPKAGDESWGRAVLEEIVEAERIVFVDSFSDADGNVNEGMPQARSTVELVDAVGGLA